MPEKVRLYNADGEPVDFYAVDAAEALKNAPDEWSREPGKRERKGAAKTGANVPSSETTTERAGPTHRDPPVTDGALRTDVSSDPVRDGDDLGEGDPARGAPDSFDKMSDADLRAYIERTTGKKPTNFVKREALEKQAREVATTGGTGEGVAG